MSDVDVTGKLTVTESGTINKDLHVKGWLYAANVRDIYVGTFTDENQLPTDAREGSIAGVVTSVGGEDKIIAYVKGRNGNWASTGAELTVQGDVSQQIANIQEQIANLNSDVAGKANTSEMSVTDGTGGNADKVTIQLKSGTSTTVLRSHQSLNGYLAKPSSYRQDEIAIFDTNGKLVSGGKTFENFASVNHTHDEYAPASGSEEYASANHNHDGRYAPASGSLNYASANHNHDNLYAPKTGSTTYATQTAVNAKADSSSVYTKTQVDDALASKANTNSVYTKTEMDTKLDAKANANGVYTKTEVDIKLGYKADSGDVYTRAQVDDKLNAKASSSSVYTKTEVDAKLDAKANVADVYTQTGTNNIIVEQLGRAVGEALRCTYYFEEEGPITLASLYYNCAEAAPILVVINGKGYSYGDGSRTVQIDSGNNVVSFVFEKANLIPKKAFKGISHLKSVHVPSYVRRIGEEAFADCGLGSFGTDGDNKSIFECECMTDPVCAGNTFVSTEDIDHVELRIHKLAYPYYRDVAPWTDFGAIKDINGDTIT